MMQGEKQASFTQFFFKCAFLLCNFFSVILRFSAVLFGRLFTRTKTMCSDSTRGECYGKQRKKLIFYSKAFYGPLAKTFREPKGKRFSFFCPFSDEEGGERGMEPNFPLPPQSFSAFPFGRHSTAAPTMGRRRNSSAETIVLRRSSAHPFVPLRKASLPGPTFFCARKSNTVPSLPSVRDSWKTGRDTVTAVASHWLER